MTSVVKYLTQLDLVRLIDEHIQETEEILACSFDSAYAMLYRFRPQWSVDALTAAYFDGDDGFTGEHGMVGQTATELILSDGKMTCSACFDDFEAGDTMHLSCGHGGCKDCWFGALQSRVEDGNDALKTRCPFAEHCEHICGPATFRKVFADEPRLLDRYNMLLVLNFVSSSRSYRRCPEPSCSMIIDCYYVETDEISCMCGYNFCKTCGASDHRPASCNELKYFLDLAQKHSIVELEKSMEWIHSHTRPCPKCQTSIEKNGGCNRMRCRHCSLDFCWVCMKSWDSHKGTNWVQL